MDFMKTVRDALALAEQAREAIAGVTSAIRGGKAGLDATTIEEAETLLAQEREESRAAHDSLADAISEARG